MKQGKIIPVNDSETGFWKLIFNIFEDVNVIHLVFDEPLSPWIIPDSANPFVIKPADPINKL